MSFSAIEIEDVIRTVDGVVDVAVVGLPDPLRDERVAAFVIRAGSGPTEAQLLELCRTMLAGYKQPEHVEFVAELPRTAVGKVQKHLLRPGMRVPDSRSGDAP